MICVALGANLPGRFGTPRAALAAALAAIANKGIGIPAVSSLWLTEPVPVSDQPWYHNAVAVLETDLSAYALLETLHAIEEDFGRVRSVRNAARVLDLDLVAYHDTVIDRPELIVPHPRMHERAFVLLPMSEVVSADWRHPVSRKPLSELVAELPDQKAQRAEGVFP